MSDETPDIGMSIMTVTLDADDPKPHLDLGGVDPFKARAILAACVAALDELIFEPLITTGGEIVFERSYYLIEDEDDDEMGDD